MVNFLSFTHFWDFIGSLLNHNISLENIDKPLCLRRGQKSSFRNIKNKKVLFTQYRRSGRTWNCYKWNCKAVYLSFISIHSLRMYRTFRRWKWLYMNKNYADIQKFLSSFNLLSPSSSACSSSYSSALGRTCVPLVVIKYSSTFFSYISSSTSRQLQLK